MFDLSPLHHVLNWQVFYIDNSHEITTSVNIAGKAPLVCRFYCKRGTTKLMIMIIIIIMIKAVCRVMSGQRAVMCYVTLN